MYKALLTAAATLLIAFGACFYLLGTELFTVKSEVDVSLLPLVCLALGIVVLASCVCPRVTDSLLSITLGIRTWTPSRGFSPDVGLQLQPFLIPAFLLALWAAMQAFLLSAGLVFSGLDSASQFPAYLLLLSLLLADRELWRICRISYERSLFSSGGRAA